MALCRQITLAVAVTAKPDPQLLYQSLLLPTTTYIHQPIAYTQLPVFNRHAAASYRKPCKSLRDFRDYQINKLCEFASNFHIPEYDLCREGFVELKNVTIVKEVNVWEPDYYGYYDGEGDECDADFQGFIDGQCGEENVDPDNCYTVCPEHWERCGDGCGVPGDCPVCQDGRIVCAHDPTHNCTYSSRANHGLVISKVKKLLIARSKKQHVIATSKKPDLPQGFNSIDI